MSAFSIFMFGSPFWNSSPSKDLSCPMLLFIRSRRFFSTIGFINWGSTGNMSLHRTRKLAKNVCTFISFKGKATYFVFFLSCGFFLWMLFWDSARHSRSHRFGGWYREHGVTRLVRSDCAGRSETCPSIYTALCPQDSVCLFFVMFPTLASQSLLSGWQQQKLFFLNAELRAVFKLLSVIVSEDHLDGTHDTVSQRKLLLSEVTRPWERLPRHCWTGSSMTESMHVTTPLVHSKIISPL